MLMKHKTVSKCQLLVTLAQKMSVIIFRYMYVLLHLTIFTDNVT